MPESLIKLARLDFRFYFRVPRVRSTYLLAVGHDYVTSERISCFYDFRGDALQGGSLLLTDSRGIDFTGRGLKLFDPSESQDCYSWYPGQYLEMMKRNVCVCMCVVCDRDSLPNA